MKSILLLFLDVRTYLFKEKYGSWTERRQIDLTKHNIIHLRENNIILLVCQYIKLFAIIFSSHRECDQLIVLP